jgi:hypothetical protein
MEQTKVVHCKKEEYDILIDRTTPFGNPFTHLRSRTLARWQVDSRAEAIQKYREWVLTSDDPQAEWIRDHVGDLRGKRLGCWCGNKPCHGSVLADLADEIPEPPEQLTFV